MSKKRDIIRIGDEVEVINPIFVKRCGYPLCISDLEKELVDKHGDDIRDFLIKVGVCKKTTYDIFDNENNRPYIPVKVLEEMARIMLRSRGFGGDERSLHTEEKTDVMGKRYSVLGRKVVKTGTRMHGSHSRSYDGEYEYDPPYLADEKTHLLFFIDESTRFNSIYSRVSEWKNKSGIGWIEAINLKKLVKEDKIKEIGYGW